MVGAVPSELSDFAVGSEKWEQFDLVAAVWVTPAEATKSAKSHRVPLSRLALAVLAEA